jgi:hypothetical protein
VGGNGVTSVYGTTSYSAGQTVLLVGKFDFDASPDALTLWVNPGASTFGLTNEPSTGALSATTSTSGVNIDRFNMRQNTAASVPAAMQWDELRFGLSWAAVTPPTTPILTTLTGPTNLSSGAFQLSYTNSYVVNGSIYASTNLTYWTPIGAATQISPGLFQFTDTTATNYPTRFYQLRSP